MDWLYELRLIRFFSLYLALIFCVSTWMRLRQYHAILALISHLRTRWPQVTRLVLAHRHIFVTWDNIRPSLLVLGLLLINTLASQLVWPHAQTFRVADLLILWPAVPVVICTTAVMVAFDVVGVLRVGEINRAEVEKYLDLAETWLTGWRAPVVRVFTLGYINPRQMVAREVRNALEGASALLNSTLWWVTVQTSFRIACGLSLWGSYALQNPIRRLLGVE